MPKKPSPVSSTGRRSVVQSSELRGHAAWLPPTLGERQLSRLDIRCRYSGIGVGSGQSCSYESAMNFRRCIGGFALFMLGIQSAWAYCPANLDYSVKGEFSRSDVVAIVKAEKVTWLDEKRQPAKLRKPLMLGNQPGGFDPYIGAYYSVRLVKAFKGRPAHSFRIFSENTTARTNLRIGPELLLFITRTKVCDEYRRADDFTVDSGPRPRRGRVALHHQGKPASTILGCKGGVFEGRICDANASVPLPARGKNPLNQL